MKLKQMVYIFQLFLQKLLEQLELDNRLAYIMLHIKREDYTHGMLEILMFVVNFLVKTDSNAGGKRKDSYVTTCRL